MHALSDLAHKEIHVRIAHADADDADRDAFEASGYGEEAPLGGQPEDVPGSCIGRGVPVKQRRDGFCSGWRANGYLQKAITCQYR